MEVLRLKEIMKAKGQLDPAFYSEMGAKQFEGKEYYNLSNSGLKIPTYLGIDFKTGYEVNKGYYINGESQTPGSGLWYAGIEIPLGEGLFFDERHGGTGLRTVFAERRACLCSARSDHS